MSDRTGSRWQSILETCALVVIAAAVARNAFVRAAPEPVARPGALAARPAVPIPRDPVSLSGAQVSGSRGAKVAMIVYSDFQCPFCGKFARETLPAVERQYVDSGKLLLAFRQYPLPIHNFAEKAAEASLCAAKQGKFWQFHDDLFANQQSLDPNALTERAVRLGLDSSAFKTCLSGEAAPLVQADVKGGTPLGVSGTPTFLVGRLQKDGSVKVEERFSGAQPLSQFQGVLDKLIGS